MKTKKKTRMSGSTKGNYIDIYIYILLHDAQSILDIFVHTYLKCKTRKTRVFFSMSSFSANKLKKWMLSCIKVNTYIH